MIKDKTINIKIIYKIYFKIYFRSLKILQNLRCRKPSDYRWYKEV